MASIPNRHVHTEEQKKFIVRRLAAFCTPRDICNEFAVLFPDTACSEADVLATNPEIAVVPPDLHALFKSTRTATMNDPDSAPLAEQKARLIILSRQAERYQANNQFAEARAVLAQIATEMGIGPKSGGAVKGPAPGEKSEPVVGITRTIVDPKEP